MHLRRPVVLVRPEIPFPEADLRFGPVNKILALDDIEAGLRCVDIRETVSVDELNIGIVLAAYRISENEWIADVNIMNMIRIFRIGTCFFTDMCPLSA